MTPRLRSGQASRLLSSLALGLVVAAAGVAAGTAAAQSASEQVSSSLTGDLNRIFADPVLARALVGVRVESLRDGRVLYAHNDDKLVMPASNMKILTMAVAAERLGWDFRYETRLEAAGPIVDGTLRGDLVVVGGGDPSIASAAGGPSPLFAEWAAMLAQAGIRRIEGRVIGDDNAFEDEGLGAGWAWDYLGAGYAAPVGALSYNENMATLRIRPGASPGTAALIDVTPAGHGLEVVNEVTTGPAGATAAVDVIRLPGQSRLTVRGSAPQGGTAITQTVSIDNPTRYFVDALWRALTARGIAITGNAVDIDTNATNSVRTESSLVPTNSVRTELTAVQAERRVLARSVSQPLSSLGAYFMKASQNFYAETILKTLGRSAGGAGTADAGKKVVRDTLVSWGIPADAVVVYDGSGLSRYNYVTAGAIVQILKRMWASDQLRGPFAAALPVAGHDGTLSARMKGTVLDARVEAKTGTISNVRALSGYLETQSGERIVFSMIANHFTAPTSEIDAVVERALARIAQ
jgi:D-alanyl-D-alanine carboxypeptidase/D-alanyl-D-alanine-endopeptidase (penicillin-binding protein 4)